MRQLAFARSTDPDTSREAAQAVAPGAVELRAAIRAYVQVFGPLTAEEIARCVNESWPGRWTQGSIVTACSPRRSGLRSVGVRKNCRGRNVQILAL